MKLLTLDRKGLESILQAGNTLVPVTEPQELGVPIARTVTARKLKLNQATGELEKHNGFKSRHSLDGGDLQRRRDREGHPRTCGLARERAGERATCVSGTGFF